MPFALFLSLLISTAHAQAPSLQESLILNAAPAAMIEVARCESGTQQFNPDGSLVRDSVTGDHVGLFQISIKQHSKDGNDITTSQGNIAEALVLYKKYGLQPWLASRDCWGKKFLADGTPRQSTDSQTVSR